MRIALLDDHHDRTTFECGVETLDRYFRTQASQDARKRVSSCFVLTGNEVSPLGFYTLAATSIALSDLPPPLAKRLPRYPSMPATLLGRLAVDRRHRGRRLGEHLLLDAFRRALQNEIATYAFVVDAKDDAAASFYAAYDFMPLTAGGRRLFLPMALIAGLFS